MIPVKTVSLAVGSLVGTFFGFAQVGGTEEIGTLLEHGITGGASATIICYLLLKGRMDVTDANHEAFKKEAEGRMKTFEENNTYQNRILGQLAKDVGSLVGAQEERRVGALHTRQEDHP